MLLDSKQHERSRKPTEIQANEAIDRLVPTYFLVDFGDFHDFPKISVPEQPVKMECRFVFWEISKDLIFN